MNIAKLKELERLTLEKTRVRQRLACVTFADGSTRMMAAPDIIPLFCSPIAGQIVDVSGGGERDEKLVALLAALVGEVPEVQI